LQVVLRLKKNETQIPFLLETFLEYIDPITCRKTNKGGFQLRVTFDKFCTYHKLGNTNLDSDCSMESIYFTVIRVSLCQLTRFGAVKKLRFLSASMM